MGGGCISLLLGGNVTAPRKLTKNKNKNFDIDNANSYHWHVLSIILSGNYVCLFKVLFYYYYYFLDL